MNRFGKLLLSGLFIIYIFIIGVYMIGFREDLEVSQIENRTLAQLPEFTAENVLNGDYMEDFESYFTDQFPGRNVWLNAYTELQLLTNRTFINGHYIGANDWVMPKPSYNFNKQSIDTATKNMNEFAAFLKNEGTEFYYFMVPHKETLFQSIYPSYMEESSLEKTKNYFLSKLDDDMVVVDMVEAFQTEFTDSELESMYFKTDHHWNGKGALEAYKIMTDTFATNSSTINTNKESLKDSHYQKECITPKAEFVGSYNKQIYMSVNSDDNEKMCAYIAKVFADYEVYKEGKQVNPDNVYFGVSKNESKQVVSYADLYTGDYRELTIVNPTVQEGNILVIKDSYANALVYQFAQNFHETTIYDIRHNEDRTVKDYIKEHDFDSVAIIYNSKKLTGSMFEFGEE